ncbi:MAG: ArgR family transcriptional regulator [Tidjanibacter sp.]|nr:ArgR family transcriptional regulator [Tidjanibacter sp.]MBR4064975.1 ArgR family transcriptional regulator [Tidjanibacter sp.]MBR6813357.1 ArgR family transcriptional regulator [Tidjanibacter sp.]MBR7102167.1 ArgR family transcriptional regulator [Tidjanibacter sp.]
MNKRTQRFSVIRSIIESEPISSQDELIIKLKEQGYEITQGTLSRDLKFMHVAKVPHREKGYIYVIPDQMAAHQADTHISSLITDNITNISFSGNIGIVHTKAGYANAVAVLLENKRYPEIAGTIAGDDTIFFVLHEGQSRKRIVRELSKLCPNIVIPQ